jgi:hypothetical protein
MPKVTLPPIGNPENSSFVTELNSALDVLADEFDKVLYRDGSYNVTDEGLDMGSFPIYNLPAPLLPTEPLRLGDVGEFQGEPGVDGTDGADAVNPNYTFNILTGAAGTDADLDVTGTYPNLTLTFTIPRGSAGASGALSDGTYSGIVVSNTGLNLDVVNNHITFARMADLAGAGVIGGTAAGDPSLLSFATVKANLGLTKADVGLANVDNTSDANKPVSTAQSAAITAAVAAPRTLVVQDVATDFTVSSTEIAFRYTGSGGTCTVNDSPALNSIITVYNDGSGNLAISASGVTIVNLAAGNTTAFSIPPMSVVNLHKIGSAKWMASPSRTV